MVIVRNALASDAEAILAFCQQIGSETDNLSYGEEGLTVSVADEGILLSEIQKSKTSHFLVAEEAGKIVGTCNCSAFRKKRLAHRAEIGIAVKKAYWNQGIGRQLLTRLIAAALNQQNWILAYQSRSGKPTDPWLQPDITETIKKLSAAGVKRAIVAPIGFVCDHVEIHPYSACDSSFS